MPDLALPRGLHAIGKRAIAEATMRRAATVGAEHVLLAIVAKSESPAAQALALDGLDFDGLSAALATERARSLAVADVDPVDVDLLPFTPGRAKPGWGASVRELLRTADKPAAKNAARSGTPGALEIELVVGILRAELGTVPRAMAIAGVNRSALIARLRELPT